jgi:hypothetical protein
MHKKGVLDADQTKLNSMEGMNWANKGSSVWFATEHLFGS